MTSSADIRRPASLRVFRYCEGDDRLQVIVGEGVPPVPESELLKLARDALHQRTFVAHAVPDDDANELCFVPRDGRCEVLSIRADVWRRHHGDHRRSLMEILNDLAAAVACGRLRFLDDDELRAELPLGEELLAFEVTDSASLASARHEIGAALDAAGFGQERRDQTVLCVSEATTNALVHGGGYGHLSVRQVPGGLRFVIADRGPGLSFLNWIEASARGQASMGYGYHIILDHVDDVALYTRPSGTTLILQQQARRSEVLAC